MDLSIVLILLIVVCNLVLASVVLFSNPKGNINRLFALMVFWLVVWTASNYLENEPVGVGLANLFVRADFATGAILSFFFLLFCLNFPVVGSLLKSPKLVLLFSPSFVLSLLSSSNLIVTDVSLAEAGVQFNAGFIFPLYALVVGGYIVGGCVSLVYKYRKLAGLQRLQTLYVLLGLSLSASFALAINLPQAFVHISADVSRLGLYGLLFFIAFTTYAIVKHRFMDIRFAFNKVAGYILMGAFVYLVFYAVVAFHEFLFGGVHNLRAYLSGTVIALLFVIVYDPIKKFLAEREILPGIYDPQDLTKSLGEVLSHELDLKKLLPAILKTLVEGMKLDGGALVVVEEKNGGFVLTTKTYSFPRISKADGVKEAFELLKVHPRILIREELEKEIKEGSLPEINREEDRRILSFLRGANTAVLLPLLSSGKILGMVLLGSKRTDGAFTIQDINFLEEFGKTASVSVERAVLYKASLEFSGKLQKEVTKATADLRRAYERLKELDKMKDEFISITSHELRTPMSSIKGYLWMLENKTEALSPNQRKYLKKAQNGSERMIALINDMLSVARIEQGRIDLKPVRFDVVKAAREIVDGFKVRTEKKGLKLEVRGPARGGVKVLADPSKVREVLGNLLDNAVKFTDKGAVAVGVKKVGRYAKIAVRDTGKGIAKADVPKLFHKFGRLERSFATVAEASGTGLGLYITKLLVERMGGEVGISSRPGKGSTFWFTLPLA